jgi:DNA invertase Pin-like site-specific DNA recombinase
MQDQSLNVRRDALKKRGCERNLTDVAGGTRCERPGLAKALKYVRRGERLIVWKLDRFGRSSRDL